MVAHTDSARRRVNLLWTGGWDSTFRLFDLVLTYGREVQPYYLIDSTRPSLAEELRAMRKLRQVLEERSPEAASLIAPTINADVEDIPPNPVTADHLRRLRERVDYLGPQYEWLARYTDQIGVDDLEMGIDWSEKWDTMCGDRNRRVEDDLGGYTAIVPEGPDSELQLLGRFRYPIVHMIKSDMEREAKERGFADLLEHTWFCHSPTRSGRPCGTCGPCRYTRKAGLARRLPRSADLRFTLYRLKYARDGIRRRLARLRPSQVRPT